MRHLATFDSSKDVLFADEDDEAGEDGIIKVAISESSQSVSQ